jgi:hypothetical protein
LTVTSGPTPATGWSGTATRIGPVAASSGTTTRNDVALPVSGTDAWMGLLKNTSLSRNAGAKSDPPMVTVSPGKTVVLLTLLTTGTGGSWAGSSLHAAKTAANVAIPNTLRALLGKSIQVVCMVFLYQGRFNVGKLLLNSNKDTPQSQAV